MAIFRWTFVLCLVVLLGGCSGSQPNGQPEGPGTGSVKDSLAHAQAPAPAPGTATIRGTVRSCTSDAEPVTCEIRIDEVVAYGASTPPMATGTRTVAVRPVVLKDRTVDALTAGGAKILTLRHAGDRPRMGSGEGNNTAPDAPDWALTRVSN